MGLLAATIASRHIPTGGGGGSDPYFSNVVLLMHGDTNFSDIKGHTMTPSADATISSAQSVFGGGSMLFAGALPKVTTPASADWNFGTSDFTVEMRVRFTAAQIGATQYLFDIGSNGSMLRIVPNTGAILVFATGGSVINTSTSAFAADTWYYLALKRVGTTFTLWRDGTQVLSGTSSNAFGASNVVLTIGQFGGGSNPFFGYMDELRLTKGVARDVSSIPASPYPDS